MAVNLHKGQSLALVRQAGGRLTRVRMGLGWEAAKKRGLLGRVRQQALALDAACLLVSGDRRLLDVVGCQQPTSRDGSVRHTGDRVTEASERDDESILVDLLALPAQVHTLVFTVTAVTGQDLSKVEKAFCRLVDESNRSELARYELPVAGSHNAQIMAKVTRDGSAWSMTAIGVAADAPTGADLLPALMGHL